MHPFDGDGMVTALTINEGKMIFRNRFVRTKEYAAEQKVNKSLFRGAFGTQRSGGKLANIFRLQVKNAANTNAIYWGKRLLALCEAGLPHAMDPLSLQTIGEYRVKGVLKDGQPFSAHPRIDSNTGNLVTYSVQTGPSNSEVTIYEFNKEFNLVKAPRSFSIPAFVFFHDFVVTENYYIFNRAPCDFQPVPFLLGDKGPAECIKFRKDLSSTIYFVPRDNSKLVEEVDVDSHFNFHFANGYEEDGKVVVDVVKSDNMVLSSDKKTDLRVPIWQTVDYKSEVPFTNLVRYEFTMESSGSGSKWKYNTRKLSDTSLDFPIVNPAVSCQKNRYVYAAAGSDRDFPSPPKGLIKLDVTNNSESTWFGEPHEFLGEPCFIPKTTNDQNVNSDEDNGYIGCFNMNGKTKQSEFLLFDAKDISKGPVHRSKLSTHIPHGLHGTFAAGLVPGFSEIQRSFNSPGRT